MPRSRQHRSFSISGSHWRSDGAPKVRYDSQAEAAAMADERGREHGLHLGIYRCDFCGGWHLGRRGRDQRAAPR